MEASAKIGTLLISIMTVLERNALRNPGIWIKPRAALKLGACQTSVTRVISCNGPHPGRMDQSSFVSLDKIAGSDQGPLAKYLDAYIAAVRAQGYLPATARKHARLIAKFSQWLRKRKC